MKSKDLGAILAPFALLANRHALSATYKTLEISPESIRGCSPYGIVEATVELDIDATFWVDANNFMAIVKSLPDDDVVLEIKGNALNWECGMATGKLAVLGQMDVPNVDWKPLKGKLWEPPDSFADALDLGSLACGPRSMASAGVYGVVIDNRDDLRILSSDNVAIADCIAGDSNPLMPDSLVLSPDALELLALLLKAKSDKPAKLDLSEKTIFCSNGPFKLMLRPAPALQHDIRALAANYSAHDAVAQIPADRIAAFIRRASALAESKQHTYIKLAAANGALSLSFAEGEAASDEYYLVEDLELPGGLPEIKLDAMRMSKVLSHANKIALDHLERGVLAFFNDKPDFSYLICGVQENSKG